jgi:phosphinothricin acetyltransferase
MSEEFKQPKMLLRAMEPGDWPAVLAIYLSGITTGNATFETDAPSWQQWDAAHLPFARIVAVSASENEVIGWAALSRVSSRTAYSGVAEVSVYVASNVRGMGVGRNLLESLIQTSERNEIWTLQASIFPENMASIALHVGCGFREVGVRKRIAQLHGTWRDTVLFERRSEVAGAT